jgi:hypothetical protein
MGTVIFNIGLAGPTEVSWQLNMGIAARMLLRASPCVPVGMFLEPKTAHGPFEPTLVARADFRWATDVSALCDSICEHTSQDCIAVKVAYPENGGPLRGGHLRWQGFLFGPRPGPWLPFDDSKFINWR